MTFGKRVRELRKTHNLSMDALGKKIGTSSSRISDWENDRTEPSSVYVVKLSKEFNVSTDFLLLGEDKITLNEDENELLRLYRQLSYREQMKLIGRAEILLEQTTGQKDIQATSSPSMNDENAATDETA